jgi:crotonobetainyl-CoA:carnitine CoA-transferase CaiB-like acyl-CoA transferase
MRYNSLEDLMIDPHLQEVGFISETEHPSEGMIKQLGLTNQFSGGVRTEFLPAPRLGENTVEIMQEFGFTTEEIETAVEQKAVFKYV